MHPDKLEGPSTILTVLGIKLDSPALQARLPKDKFDCITSQLDDWLPKKHYKQKELESLIGHLHHACKVVPLGRTFQHRMINLLAAFRRDEHPIHLNSDFHQDLSWWCNFFRSRNGTSFFLPPRWTPLPDFQVSSDAAGTLGYGPIFDREWFACAWSLAQASLSMVYKELFPVVVAAAPWGFHWSNPNEWNFVRTTQQSLKSCDLGLNMTPT